MRISKVSGYLLGLWLFLQGLATIWPAFSSKTIPAWFAEQGWLVSPSVFGWASILVGVLVIAILIYQSFFNGQPKAEWAEKLEALNRMTYTNCEVEVDGKLFNDCKFTNVTLFYHGTGDASFVECKFAGTLVLKSDNKAAKVFQTLNAGFSKLPNFKPLFVAEVSIQSGEMHVIHDFSKKASTPTNENTEK